MFGDTDGSDDWRSDARYYQDQLREADVKAHGLRALLRVQKEMIEKFERSDETPCTHSVRGECLSDCFSSINREIERLEGYEAGLREAAENRRQLKLRDAKHEIERLTKKVHELESATPHEEKTE